MSDHESESDDEEINDTEKGPAARTPHDMLESSLLHRFAGQIPHDIGHCDDPCAKCSALHWKLERTQKTMHSASATYSTCCQQGAVRLPSDHMENTMTPPFLQRLFTSQDSTSKKFRANIRSYNNAVSFTSTAAKQDMTVAGEGGSWSYRIRGSLTHLIGSLLPVPNADKKFAQMFIFGDQAQDEIALRTPVDSPMTPNILQQLLDFMYAHNAHAKTYKAAEAILGNGPTRTIKIKSLPIAGRDKNRYNFPTCSQVAAIIEGDGKIGSKDRDVIVHLQSGKLRRISELNTNYFSLRYPLFYMHGSHGWDEHYRHFTLRRKSGKVTALEWFAYTLFDRKDVFSPILRGGRLFQEYLVDMYVCVENARLKFIRNNQKKLRAELYNGVTEALNANDTSTIGRNVVLPASFSGGPRSMQQLYQDAMALVKSYGAPSLFITMTASSHWPELKRALLPGQTADDRPDLLARVYRLKLKEMHKDVIKRFRLGVCISDVHTIEFQKRGAPHAHTILILDKLSTPRTPEQVDLLVRATIPDPQSEPLLYHLVTELMVHGPCGSGKSCWNGHACKYGFPKAFQDTTIITDGSYPQYKRPNDGSFFIKNGNRYTNQDIVAYNPFLLLKYQCHMNIEIAVSMKAVKYLYKYIAKGHDRLDVSLETESEPNDFVNGRYLGASEAAWRLLKYPLSGRHPAIERLTLHDEDNNMVYFRDAQGLRAQLRSGTAKRTTLTEYMRLCYENQPIEKSRITIRSLLYTDMTRYFRWHKGDKEWVRRTKDTGAVSRLYFARPGHGDRYYLRLLLTQIPGVTSFAALRSFNGILYNDYRAAAEARGLLMSDEHYDSCLTEAALWKTGGQLRAMFALILVHSPPANSQRLWDTHVEDLVDDCRYRLALTAPTVTPSECRMENYGLALLERNLADMGATLQSVGLKEVDSAVLDEIGGCAYDPDSNAISPEFSLAEIQESVPKLTPEQLQVYDSVRAAIDSNNGRCMFVDGPGGCGKTFLLNTCLHYCNAHGIPVVAVASSGIASLLLLRGGTAHSRLKIPIPADEASTCTFTPATAVGRELIVAQFMVWDEISMMNKQAIECVDRSLRDLRSCDLPFGGLSILFSGDFRQILPVVLHGGVMDSVHACFKFSPLWRHVQQFKLTVNMRLRTTTTHDNTHQYEAVFARWLLNLGSGHLQDMTTAKVSMEHVQIISVKPGMDLTSTTIKAYYAAVNNLITRKAWHELGLYYARRAIITTLNITVNSINRVTLNSIAGRKVVSTSLDEIDEEYEEEVTPDILNTFEVTSFPSHVLELKTGSVVVLLRNLNLVSGLCNGTRLLVTEAGEYALECLIITGPKKGTNISLPKMRLHHAGNESAPVSFYRLQFPVALAFAMTINKAQGQTLEDVCVVLKTPVFAHGQLYVALSRCTSSSGTTVLLTESEQTSTTTNVVYKPVTVL